MDNVGNIGYWVGYMIEISQSVEIGHLGKICQLDEIDYLGEMCHWVENDVEKNGSWGWKLKFVSPGVKWNNENVSKKS